MARRKAQRAGGQRRSKKKLPRSIIIVCCEGTAEHNYFTGLKRHLQIPDGAARINVVDCGNEGDAKRLLAFAKKKHAQLDPFEKDLAIIWLLYDCEPHDGKRYEIGRKTYAETGGHFSLPNVKERSADRTYFVSISWPCFEIWLLMHHERDLLAKINNPAKAKTTFEKNFWALPEIYFEKLLPNLSIAENKAKRLWDRLTKETNYPNQGATSAHLLVAHLKDLQKPMYH